MATTDVEEAVGILKSGAQEEQKAMIESLYTHSNTQPEDLIPYLDVICSFAGNDDVDVRHNVAHILANIARHDLNAVMTHSDTVCEMLTDNNPSILSAMTGIAGRIAHESPPALLDATDRLLELLTYESDWASDQANKVRGRTARTLGSLGEHDPSIAARIDDPLANRLTDSDPKVRGDVVVAITYLGLAHPEAIPTALAQIPKRLDDDHGDVRRNAIIAYVHFQRKQPDAIVKPDAVAPVLRQAAERTDLNSTEEKNVAETYEYIEEMAMSNG